MQQIRWTNIVRHGLSEPLNAGQIKAEALYPLIHEKDFSKLESYHFLWDLDFRADYVGYKGPVRPASGWHILDFDSNDGGLRAKEDINRILLEVPIPFYTLFSGNKGFHLYFRQEYLNVPHDEFLPKKWKHFLTRLKEKYPTLDPSISDSVRKIRVPGSLHQKSGKNKDKFIPVVNPPEPFLYEPWSKLIEETPTRTLTPEILSPKNSDQVPFIHKIRNKKCIEQLLTEISDNRNADALLIVSDLQNQGYTIHEATKIIEGWSTKNQTEEGYKAIKNTYETGKVYTFSCDDPRKSLRCHGQCAVYRNLSPVQRPPTGYSTAPLSLQKQYEKALVKVETKNTEENTFKSVIQSLFASEEPLWISESPIDGSSLYLDVNKEILIQSVDGSEKESADEIFSYSQGHWKIMPSRERTSLRKVIGDRYAKGIGNDETPFDQANLFSVFKSYLKNADSDPRIPRLASPRADKVNFRNGILHMDTDIKTGNNSLRMSPHNPLEYVSYLTDITLDLNDQKENYNGSVFLNYLNSCFSPEDHYREEKIRALQLMAGAMLVPFYPQIFFCLGQSGSGKSTIIGLLSKMIPSRNQAGNDINQLGEKFDAESLLGKTVNICTDITVNCKLPLGFFKKIFDGIPILVERKGLPGVLTQPPKVYVFGANALPTNHEPTKALHHRFTIIKFTGNSIFDREGVEIKKNYENVIWANCSDYVIAWAIEGLKKLVSLNGRFPMMQSSREEMKQWEIESQPVKAFLHEITETYGLTIKGKTIKRVKLNPDLHVKDKSVDLKELFLFYSGWCEESKQSNPWMASITQFNKFMRLEPEIIITLFEGKERVHGFISENSKGDF